MKRWTIPLIVSLAALAGQKPGVLKAQEAVPVQDLGGEVRGIFATKCAGCHGPDLAKPKGRFGYVLDLRKVAANPEMVIPHRPDESELWVLVSRDEMPPADSPQGSLTPAEKEIVRAWIADGAPDASTPSEITTTLAPAPLSTADRMIRWLGKFHLLLLHFPIALILAAALGEAWAVWRRSAIPSDAVRYCLLLGAIAAIPTAGLGWLFAAAGNGVSSPQLLMAHRWLGTTAAVWLVVAAVSSEQDARRGRRSLRMRLLLIGGVGLIALTAHLGGLLDRGEDFFAY
jgi:mono/diheme cytochrome c family protein/uncharacterized membrane protein